VTISAAAVAVFGAALSLTASSALNVENTSTQAGAPAAESAPLTSASPYPVLAPISAAPAAEAQPPAAPPARPETIAVPQHSASVSPPAPVSAAVPDIPLPGSLHGVPPGPQYVAPLGMPPGPQPAAPLAVPAAPQPVAPLGLLPEPEPLGPPAAASVPSDAADAPPPPDPVQSDLGPALVRSAALSSYGLMPMVIKSEGTRAHAGRWTRC
jgi:hypothetical protein